MVCRAWGEQLLRGGPVLVARNGGRGGFFFLDQAGGGAVLAIKKVCPYFLCSPGIHRKAIQLAARQSNICVI
jgi:hypothetical protein